MPEMQRRKTRIIKVGNVEIGGANPVRVQTMLNTDTLDINASVRQIRACVSAGAELVRLAVPSLQHVAAFAEIKKKVQVPLIADVHFNAEVAIESLRVADKVRINPGNFPKAELESLIKAAKQLNKPLRIGVNHGSLSKDQIEKFGEDATAMAAATIEYLNFFREREFEDLIVAIKASDPLMMIEANRLLVREMDKAKMDYPLHLGVTEAGSGEEGRIKSELGIGTLLMEGIGDTIRVSLTEDPVCEVELAYSLLQVVKRRISKTEFVSCPGCSRTLFHIEKLTQEIKEKFSNLKGVKIAIMGCVVNGLGEARDADFALVGGKDGMVNLYQKGKLAKKDIPAENAARELGKYLRTNN
ncbi:MAG: (E)-4-hydroxy-3-methylbut-2-enyl-diphosphate synthase [Candidatus Gracilibacteria bacterium]|nr:(E)-4-hydroxy-3-methylbut-2-enyl-diphosphate synthase [Candidatus Gracilibacteria bacterium]